MDLGHAIQERSAAPPARQAIATSVIFRGTQSARRCHNQ